jgi:integrase/recombinase XerD
MSGPESVRVSGPLAVHVEGFLAVLRSRGYAAGSAANQLRLAAHLSRWLAEEELEAADLTPERVEAFVRVRHSGYANLVSVRGLAPLLGYLREVEAVPISAAEPTSPVEGLLSAYREYLMVERGLTEATADRNSVIARVFLDVVLPVGSGQCGGELALLELTATEVVAFVVRESAVRSVGSAKLMISGLRSFLRFLHVTGRLLGPLDVAVPGVAGWRGGSLPQVVSAGQVSAMLASCDRRRAGGRRDFAILMLLSRLGMRAGEVGALDLADFDWASGELIVRGKGRRQERLPLPSDVGEAVAGYLRRGRPRLAGERAVFVSMRAPRGRLGGGGVKQVVRSACDRAGVPRIGSHRLRHTMATQMLRAGAGLGEVGQVLRHRDLSTTVIYAKVDRTALRALARPWPGGAR